MRLLRGDLTISPRPDEAGCLLLDPQTGQEYEFGEVEQFLLEHFRLSFDHEQLCREFNARFGLSYAVKDVESFHTLLGDWGLLRPQEESALPASAVLTEDANPSDSLTGNFSQKVKPPNRWHWFNPEKFLDTSNRIFPGMRWMVWLTPFVVAIGITTIWQKNSAFQADFAIAQIHFGVLARFVLTALTLNMVTQITRGMLARRLGLATPSFGVLLGHTELGFLPRFNVQIVRGDQLERASRLLFFGLPALIRFWSFGIMVLLWAITRPSGTFLSIIALEFALMSMLSLLFVANPFWRGDGSSFLSAWLETPGNVRKSSFKALLGFIVKRPAAIARHNPHNPWLGLFGLIALTLFCGYLGFIAYTLFQYLETRFHGFGVALFLIFGAYASYSLHLNNTWTKAAQASKQENRQESSASNPSGSSRRAKSTGKTRPWGRYLFFMVMLVILFLPYRSDPGGSVEIFPAARVTVTLDVDGLLEQVNFNGGEEVKIGTVLAGIADYNQSYALRMLEADIESQKNKIKQYQTTPSVEDIRLAEEKIRTARLQAAYSAEKLAKQESLALQGFISPQALDDVRAISIHDQQALKEVIANLDSIKAQVNPYQIQGMMADLKKMQIQADYDGEKLRRTKLVSPIAGRIVTTDLQYLRNSFMTAGKKFADIEDQRTVILRISVPEADLSYISVGAPITVKLFAYSNRTFVGKVEQIPPVASPASSTASTSSTSTTTTTVSDRYVQVQGRLDNPEGLLLTGLTGNAKITGKETIALVAFTRALVRFVTIDAWSWLP